MEKKIIFYIFFTFPNCRKTKLRMPSTRQEATGDGYTALGYSLVFFSLSYPAFHTGLSKGNACGVLRLCRAVRN
ncbi:MAG: hypothetical protein LBR08_02190, partial [Bacteroidales bacterium]|nr:hypothetical protein [Bacteroidales bacterium]